METFYFLLEWFFKVMTVIVIAFFAISFVYIIWSLMKDILKNKPPNYTNKTWFKGKNR